MSSKGRVKHCLRGLPMARCHRTSIESLEQRWCPAVAATFSSGTLSVVGDSTSNTVDVVDYGQGEIAIVGDGQRQSFMDVDEIFIETEDGDDKVSYTPFTVTFGGTLAHINVGDGDDQIRVSDGPASDAHIRNQATTLSMDLGRGNDGVDVDIHHDDQVDLDIRSSDGGDRIQIGMHLVVKKRGNTRMDFHLGAGGNLVSVQTRNFDVVDAAIETIASADRAGEALPADSFSLDFANTTDSAGQQRHFHGFPGRLSIGGKFGDTDDQLTIDSQGFENVSDHLVMGGGNDTARIRHRMFAIVDRTNVAHVDAALGDGSDQLSVDLDGYDQLGLTADLGDGNDAVTVLLRRLANPGLPPSADPSSLEATIRMGAGVDNVSMMTHGYRRIATDIDTGPAGDGRDVYMGKYLTLRPRPLDRSSTTLDGGNDQSEIVAMGYGSVDVQTEQTRQITVIQDI
jgi:hypothetical protein